MRTALFHSAAVWTVLGLASGLFYREFTKFNDVAGGTQVAVVHTHTLTLGTMMMLLWLALVAQFPRAATDKLFRIGFWLWQGGLALTTGGLLVKGCLQVLDHSLQNSPLIAGFSGLGHLTLAVAFILFFLGLRRALPAADRSVAPAVREGAAV